MSITFQNHNLEADYFHTWASTVFIRSFRTSWVGTCSARAGAEIRHLVLSIRSTNRPTHEALFMQAMFF